MQEQGPKTDAKPKKMIKKDSKPFVSTKEDPETPQLQESKLPKNNNENEYNEMDPYFDYDDGLKVNYPIHNPNNYPEGLYQVYSDVGYCNYNPVGNYGPYEQMNYAPPFIPVDYNNQMEPVFNPGQDYVDYEAPIQPNEYTNIIGEIDFKNLMLNDQMQPDFNQDQDKVENDVETFEEDGDYEDYNDKSDEEEMIAYRKQMFEECDCCEGDVDHCSGLMCNNLESCFCHSLTKYWGFDYKIKNLKKEIELIEKWQMRVFYPKSKDCKDCLGWVFSPEITELCVNCLYERIRLPRKVSISIINKKNINKIKLNGKKYIIKGDTKNTESLSVTNVPYCKTIDLKYSESCICRKGYIKEKPCMEICNCFYEEVLNCRKSCNCSEEKKKNEEHFMLCEKVNSKKTALFNELMLFDTISILNNHCRCCNGFPFSCFQNNSNKLCSKLEACHCYMERENEMGSDKDDLIT